MAEGACNLTESRALLRLLGQSIEGLERRAQAFVDIQEIDWSDATIGRRFLRFGRRTDSDTEEELAFLIPLLHQLGCHRILDLMCGDGRIAIPLAAQGFEVIGVDVNSYAIEEARKEAKEAGVTGVVFEVGDAREWVSQQPVDAVICIFGHFSGFTRAQAKEILQCQASSLRKGGSLILDMHLSPSYLEALEGQRDWDYFRDGWLGTDNAALVLDDYTCNMDNLSFVRRSVCLDLQDGEVTCFGQAGQFYSPTTMKALAGQAGFQLNRCWGGFDGHEYVDWSPNLIAWLSLCEECTE